MRYQRVRWRQESAEFPTLLYSEIDSDGWEVRKVDEYANGHRDLAGKDVETGRTMLGLDRIPALDRINADPQFEAAEISAEEFDAVWNAAKTWFDLP